MSLQDAKGTNVKDQEKKYETVQKPDLECFYNAKTMLLCAFFICMII